MSRTSYFQQIAHSPAKIPVLQPAHSIAPRPEVLSSLDMPLESAQEMNVLPASISQPVVDTARTPQRQHGEIELANVPATEIGTKGYSASTVPPGRDISAASQTNTPPLVTSSVQRPVESEATLSLTIPQAHSKRERAISASPVDAVPPALGPAQVMTSSQEARPAAKQEQAKESLASAIAYKDDVTRQHTTNAVADREDADALKLVPTASLRPLPVPLLPRLEEKAADSSQARAAKKQQKATLHIGSIDVYIVPPPAPASRAADVNSAPSPRPTGSLSRELISPIGLRQG